MMGVVASFAIGLMLPATCAFILWAVWFFGPKPRGSFREHVESALGLRMYNLPSVSSPWSAPEFAFDLTEEHAEPLIPEGEPRRPTSTAERRSKGQRTRIQREEIEGALDDLVRGAVTSWAESRPDESDKRDEAYRLVGVIRSLRTRLRQIEDDGEMAAREEMSERLKRPSDNRA